MNRPYAKLSRNKLTRLALTSQEAGVIALAMEEMERRPDFPIQIVEFAAAHLLTVKARDLALQDLHYFKVIIPKLEQRVQELESRDHPFPVN